MVPVAGGVASGLAGFVAQLRDHVAEVPAAGEGPAGGGSDAPGTPCGRSMRFDDVYVTAAVSLAGPTEGRGPLGSRFDEILPDHLLGERSWERAESRALVRAVQRLCLRQGRRPRDYDLLLAGDLLNQTIASAFAARELDLPYCGLYNACATFCEGLGLAGALCASGLCRRVVVAVSSHHDAAERQYRFPTELGNQRPPSAQWTATGAVAVAVERGQRSALAALTGFTPGRVIDFQVADPFQMGAAMAPAAADTIAAHLRDLASASEPYDAVVTGDLGAIGLPICTHLLAAGGRAVPLYDCGLMLYDRRHQDVHAGGSGTACSALVCAARILPALGQDWRRVCLCATGSLHSVTTYQQGESIPAVAHAVTLEAVR